MKTITCNNCGGTGINGFTLLDNRAIKCGYCNGSGRTEKL